MASKTAKFVKLRYVVVELREDDGRYKLREVVQSAGFGCESRPFRYPEYATMAEAEAAVLAEGARYTDYAVIPVMKIIEVESP